jgi:hypothetical protein
VTETNGPGSAGPPDHQDGWEYLYFASELARGIGEHESAFEFFAFGFVRPTGEQITDTRADISERSQEISRTVGNIDRLLSAAVLEQAFGPPGTPGDEDTIRQVTSGLVEVYAAMLRWAQQVRGATVPESWQPVYVALADFVEQPLHQFREFSSKLTKGVEVIVGELRSGRAPTLKLELKLTISIDPMVRAKFDEALRGVQ